MLVEAAFDASDDGKQAEHKLSPAECFAPRRHLARYLWAYKGAPSFGEFSKVPGILPLLESAAFDIGRKRSAQRHYHSLVVSLIHYLTRSEGSPFMGGLSGR